MSQFAVAREPIPNCILPEVEVFLGDVPITKYETPGGQAFADTILPFVDKTNVILLANHGTVSYGVDVEQADQASEPRGLPASDSAGTSACAKRSSRASTSGRRPPRRPRPR